MIGLILTGYLTAAAAPMTLDDAIQVATENAFSLKVAGANVEKVRQQINEAKGLAGPQLVASGLYTRFESATIVQFGSSSVVVSPVEAQSATFTLSLPIDIMGNIRRGVKAASFALRASKDTLQAQKNDLKLSVRSSFYRVLQAQELVKVSEDALTGAKERLDNAKKQFDVGVIAKVDVMRYETALAQAQSDLIASQNALELSKSGFNNALGRPIETAVSLAPVGASPAQDRSVEDLVGIAVKVRPEIRAVLNQVEVLRYVREAQERGSQPSFGVAAVETQNFTGGFGSRKENFTASISMSWPLFDSGITRARVKQARQDEVVAKTQFDQLTLGVSLEVRQAITSLVNARSRVEVAKRQVAFAAENYRLAKVRQQAGEGIALEVIDAQTADTQAKAGLVAANYDYLTAYSQLQRAIGDDDVANARASEAKETRK